MFRRILIICIMVPLLAGAAAAKVSFPVLLLMLSLLLIALSESSARDEQLDCDDRRLTWNKQTIPESIRRLQGSQP